MGNCYRYDSKTAVYDNDVDRLSTLQERPPLPSHVRNIINESFSNLKKKKCKIRWTPLTDYKPDFQKKINIKGNHIHTFQIEESCVDLADIEEDRLGKLGITFDSGTGFGWRDWELDCIVLKDKLEREDILLRDLNRKVTKKFLGNRKRR